jgi:hypothetical protein
MSKPPFSLKGLIPRLAHELDMTPDALYERQRALVRAGLLKGVEGKGPGSGVRATPYATALLLIAVLATDSLSEVGERTKQFASLKAEAGSCPATGKKTFVSALAAILASPRLSRDAHTIIVDRGGHHGPSAHIGFIQDEEYDSWFVTKPRKSRSIGKLDIRASLRGWPLEGITKFMALWWADLDEGPTPSEL